jgi:hypothetical protein
VTGDANEREYFRIEDRLSIDFRYVSPEEFLRLESIIRYHPSCKSERPRAVQFEGDFIVRAEGEEKELFAYMKVLDKKLDMIIELLEAKKSEDAYKSLYTRVNISGAGIRFLSDGPLNMGARVELRIALPTSPFSRLSTLCEVVRTEQSATDEGTGWQIALKFIVINEYDRDVLINYIFTKEREKMRSEKDDG